MVLAVVVMLVCVGSGCHASGVGSGCHASVCWQWLSC